MDVQLRTKGQVEVYDVITTFAVSAPAVGLQKLCQHAQLNDNYIDEKSIEGQFKLKPGASRNLFINGIQSGVWTKEGKLTDEGHETALTGDVLIKEVGPLRIWTYENEVTGPVLLHAGRSRTVKQFAETTPQTKHAPNVLDSISDGGMLVVEDTHTSYLEGFGAQTHSFVKYAKIWIDRINSRFCEFNTDQSGRKVWSMEIFDSIIAFKINKDSSELKSEEICSVEEAQYDGDFRAEDNVIVENKSEEITPIMQGAFSVEGLPNENNVVSEGDVMITKNQLVGLVENWLEQKPEAKDELLDLISKSCKT